MIKLLLFALIILVIFILVLGHEYGEDVYDAVDEIIKDFADEPVEENERRM